MRRVYWSIFLGLAILLGGIVLGIGGLLLAPIIGVVVLIGVLLWLAERKAEHKPPVE